MSENEIELNIVDKVKKILNLSGDIEGVELSKKLYKYRLSLHPDKFTDEESQKVAKEKFIECTNLITQLNSFINSEKIKKKPKEITVWEKDYEIINTQQKVIQSENYIDILNNKITKYRKVIKQLLEQNRLLTKEVKEDDYKSLISSYKKNSTIKIGIGLKVFFGLSYSIIINIDELTAAMFKYIPIPETILNVAIFIIILISILLNLRELIRNKIIKERARSIQTTSFISDFSISIKEDHYGSKVSEIQIYKIVERAFIPKNKFSKFINKILSTNTSVIIEAYKNIFVNFLIEKQLIKVSKAKKLDREFYVYGTSWNERHYSSEEKNVEIIDDTDIDSYVDSFDE